MGAWKPPFLRKSIFFRTLNTVVGSEPLLSLSDTLDQNIYSLNGTLFKNPRKIPM